ncbi:hypothetical protein [Thalassotalea sp. PLHSN55]|uniref:hypothetical protein n=1 Tax=Thalassotalea sp. PLHSN55 TaxID=3435888 RepID=UPI003F8689B3
MLVIQVFAVLILVWFAWQLYRAKQFTKFKNDLTHQVQPQVVNSLIVELEENRSEMFPNNEAHQEAAIYYWTQYRVRILQFALEKELLTKEGLVRDKKWRHCQHLFHVEKQYLAPSRVEPIAKE